MSVIIGIGGEKAVGKDTAAAILTEKYGFVRAAFADPLKNMCAYALGIPVARMHDPVLKERAYNPIITVYPHHVDRMADYSQYMGYTLSKEQKAALKRVLSYKSFATIRLLLQFVGTEGFRESVADDYWLKIFLNSIKNADRVVVTDMRFPNERQFVAGLGGILVRVKRNTGTAATHASEKSLGEDAEYSLVIQNDSSIPELQERLEQFYVARNSKSSAIEIESADSGTAGREASTG